MQHAGFASELKFKLTTEVANQVREWARRELVADPYAVDIDGDGYSTTSIYFETDDFDVFFRRGSQGRAKFRIRRYNNGPVVFLERKLKRSGVVIKRRSEALPAELERVATDDDWQGRWFARRLANRDLKPVCQIEYRRMARVGMVPSGPVRLTLDRHISAVPLRNIAFTSDPGVEIMPGEEVLELKYRVYVPPLFKQLIEDLNLEPRPISKYRMAIEALGLAGDPQKVVVHA